MHSNGSLIRYLVEDRGVILDAEFEFQWGIDGPLTYCNALSYILYQSMNPNSRYIPSIFMINLLFDLGAKTNIPFNYASINQGERLVHSSNGHSLLHVSFRCREDDGIISQILLKRGAHFNRLTDISPMVTAMSMTSNKGVIIHLFHRFGKHLEPWEIATHGAQLGTPLHNLAGAPPYDNAECNELVSILIRDMGISPFMVDEHGRTAKDIAEIDYKYYRSRGPHDTGLAEHARYMMDVIQEYMDEEHRRRMSVAALSTLSRHLPPELHSDIFELMGDSVNGLKNTKRAVERVRVNARARATSGLL
jgi:hypothetical protein